MRASLRQAAKNCTFPVLVALNPTLLGRPGSCSSRLERSPSPRSLILSDAKLSGVFSSTANIRQLFSFRLSVQFG
jgi:hypothetical protein